MPVGRPPKPTAMRLLNGKAGHRPINDKEPKFEPSAPDAPEHLNPEGREEWDRVCTRLVAAGVMTQIDRAALAAYCQAYGRWVQAENVVNSMAERDPNTNGLLIKSAKNNPMCNPMISIANVAMRDMLRCAAEFGMTPSARSRIKATDAVSESDNPFLVLKHG